jgi:hypothetical protein
VEKPLKDPLVDADELIFFGTQGGRRDDEWTTRRRVDEGARPDFRRARSRARRAATCRRRLQRE